MAHMLAQFYFSKLLFRAMRQ